MKYYFPKMYEFFKAHILACEACQKSKPVVHPSKTPIQNLPVCEPLSRWVLDHHGSLVNSDGYTHVLVAIDSASMWVELIPVEDVSAKTTVQALFDNVIARYGLCRGFSIQSDRGTAFANELANEFCRTFMIKQFFSTPVHAQSNSRAEKMGQVIYQSLKALAAKQENWSRHLQAIAMAHRGTVTSNTLLSPFESIFGRTMLWHCDWALLAEQPALGHALAYADDIRPKIAVLREVAMANLKTSAEDASNRYNIDAQEP